MVARLEVMDLRSEWEHNEHPISDNCDQPARRKNLSHDFRFVGKIDLYSLAGHCRICQREVFSKLSSVIRRLLHEVDQALA